ncbi:MULTISPECIES: phage integrase N-terminal domain-containing protein [Ralstonia solanacearum species complex]|uniref:phage integrase N-terminal domain-containing protein n=1 Tax=Ralstonia solanacearum species complex TaxID=3116862 RepID=UPI000E5900A0|nr:phage integrase N-terminal domain-containing protein [Ralstonia solanacearum]BEU72574.1 integrase domain-containing protein [Ralstonia pseudosolanacearum]AXV77429.1 integrase [Ralstonia solanacearum]AXV91449.1 integrase [Ralstonia solanacearum]AXW19573.1 integrase [Ralstonia solanacearum]AXW76345.1 integrase [Ralstonia solanacearum]
MKHVLVRELVQLCDRNRDGSFSTQAARKTILIQAGKDLLAAGFRNLGVAGLKPKHIGSLVDRWTADGVSDATMKNRLSHLRWVVEKIGKQNIVPRTNAELGIGRRRYVTNESKAVTVSDDALAKITDERLRISIELQRAFGLRRAEAIKFTPSYAMAAGDDRIFLKSSWCKGGRAREVPIRNGYQGEVLARAAALAGTGSMIPPNKRYVDQLKRYENATARAGLSKLHGLRHEYAQHRYHDLAGWECPAKGGPTAKQLTPEQKTIDLRARLQISQELGHNREAITGVYLGR